MSAKNKSLSPHMSLSGLDPIPENLFRHPLDYIQENLFRLRALRLYFEKVWKLGEKAATQLNIDAMRITRFLDEDLVRHFEDEDEDLFPRLKDNTKSTTDRESCRGMTSFSFKPLIDLLVDDHRRLHLASINLSRHLRDNAENDITHNATHFWHSVWIYCEVSRCICEIESKVLIPAARNILNDTEIEAIGRSMATRRGDDFPANHL